MFGFLPINKPSGISSRSAVNTVAKVVRTVKVGHTGTLDPLATGVLVLAIGPATRLARFVQDSRKRYNGSFRLGVTSDTDDAEVELSPVAGALPCSEQQLRDILSEFTGTISQVPPTYSAVHVAGQRAYRLARAGKRVELQPREVTVHSLKLTRFDYPDFELDIECGSGTYIRSLGRDIGTHLSSGAVMTGLVRTAVGNFHLRDAVELKQLDKQRIAERIVAPVSIFGNSARIPICKTQQRSLANGNQIAVTGSNISGSEFGSSPVAIDERGRLLAVLQQIEPGIYKPKLNFCHYQLSDSS